MSTEVSTKRKRGVWLTAFLIFLFIVGSLYFLICLIPTSEEVCEIPPYYPQEPYDVNIGIESGQIFPFQSTGVLIQLSALTKVQGEENHFMAAAVQGQEVVFTTDFGTVRPERAVTDEYGEVWVRFHAPGKIGRAIITAQALGVSNATCIWVEVSPFEKIIFLICLLVIAGIAILKWRLSKKVKK